jgi:hypothetical protein
MRVGEGGLHCAIEAREKFPKLAKIMMGRGGMSRDLSPTEFRICRMVFAFLAIMVFAFLVSNAIDFLFSLFTPVPPVRTVQMQPGTTRSTTPHSPAKPLSHSSPHVPQKEPAGDVVPVEPAPASLSYMKTRLEQLGQMTLEKAIWFDAQALDRGRDANSVVVATAEPAVTETSLPQWEARVIATSATTTEPLAMESPQETKLQPEPTAPPPQPASKEVSLGADERVPQIKSRLRNLGYLSAVKGDGWDASTRNALRDFKLINHLPNDDVWDQQTSTKLNSQTAIRVDRSIIGNWSTGPCRPAKSESTQLSIGSRRTKSSAGSICEFRDLQSTNREWRVRANCSQGSQHWVANGKFAMVGDKLVWTSERDVISYFRCN